MESTYSAVTPSATPFYVVIVVGAVEVVGAGVAARFVDGRADGDVVCLGSFEE